MPEADVRYCAVCTQTQPITEFPKHHGLPGRRDECRACVAAMTEKPCRKCAVVKPLEEFGRRKDTVDGRHGACKECLRGYGKVRYAKMTADKPRRTTFAEEFPELEPIRQRAYARVRYAQNREKFRERAREYNVRNPHVGWRTHYLERARQFGFAPVTEEFTKDDVIARWGAACWHCGGEFEHLDHFPVAVRDGGPHTLESVRPSCASCNLRGGAEMTNRPQVDAA